MAKLKLSSLLHTGQETGPAVTGPFAQFCFEGTREAEHVPSEHVEAAKQAVPESASAQASRKRTRQVVMMSDSEDEAAQPHAPVGPAVQQQQQQQQQLQQQLEDGVEDWASPDAITWKTKRPKRQVLDTPDSQAPLTQERAPDSQPQGQDAAGEPQGNQAGEPQAGAAGQPTPSLSAAAGIQNGPLPRLIKPDTVPAYSSLNGSVSLVMAGPYRQPLKQTPLVTGTNGSTDTGAASGGASVTALGAASGGAVPTPRRLQSLSTSILPSSTGTAAKQSSVALGGVGLRALEPQAPDQRRQAAQFTLQQVRRRKQRVTTFSDESGSEEEREREANKNKKNRPSLLSRVELISNTLQEMVASSAMTDKLGAGADGSAASVISSGGHTLIGRDQVAEACGPDVAARLKSYQLIGINFLMMLSRSGTVGGAILADEMGLGKTAQVIVVLGLLQHHAMRQWQTSGKRGDAPCPHLVICPASLLENWQRELAFWCPSLRVVSYYGKDRPWLRGQLEGWQSRARRTNKKHSKPTTVDDGEEVTILSSADEEEEPDSEEEEFEERIGFKLCDPASGVAAPFDVMLTTYSMYERDGPDARMDRGFLNKWKWDHLVADEAHALKNRNSTRVQKLFKLASSCGHRLLITGTPLQNDLSELVNLLRFLMPALFKGDQEDQEEEDFADEELKAAGQDEKAQAEVTERVRRIMTPFILRRLKTEVASQLVPKTHKLIEVDMVPEQAEAYHSFIKKLRAEVTGKAPASITPKQAEPKQPKPPTEQEVVSLLEDSDDSSAPSKPPAAPTAAASTEAPSPASTAAAPSRARGRAATTPTPSTSEGPTAPPSAAPPSNGKRGKPKQAKPLMEAVSEGGEAASPAVSQGRTTRGASRAAAAVKSLTPPPSKAATKGLTKVASAVSVTISDVSGDACADLLPQGGSKPKSYSKEDSKLGPSALEVCTVLDSPQKSEMEITEQVKGTGFDDDVQAADTSDMHQGPAERAKARAKASAAQVSDDGDMVGTAQAASGLVAKLGAQKVNNIFTHLRKIALHPLLVRRLYNEKQMLAVAEAAVRHQLFGGQCTMDKVTEEMSGWSDYAVHCFALEHPRALAQFKLPLDTVYSSGKLQLLKELLKTLKAAGSKVLLFSQWTQMLDVLEWFMDLEGYSYVRLDGNTQVADRLTIVDKFNSPEGNVFVFLLSTRAGGQGLNLVGADTVILHDVDFNPQVDRQAEDRCHRLGQTRPVTVYRLVTRGTVDRNIYDIAQRKLRLDAAVLEHMAVSTMGADELDGVEDAEDEGKAGGKGRGKKAGGKGAAKEPVGDVRQIGAILAALLHGQ